MLCGGGSVETFLQSTVLLILVKVIKYSLCARKILGVVEWRGWREKEGYKGYRNDESTIVEDEQGKIPGLVKDMKLPLLHAGFYPT